jgi:hypothetical protein
MATKKATRIVTLVRWKIIWDGDERSLYTDTELYLHRTRRLATQQAGPSNDVCRATLTVDLPAKKARKK